MVIFIRILTVCFYYSSLRVVLQIVEDIPQKEEEEGPASWKVSCPTRNKRMLLEYQVKFKAYGMYDYHPGDFNSYFKALAKYIDSVKSETPLAFSNLSTLLFQLDHLVYVFQTCAFFVGIIHFILKLMS